MRTLNRPLITHIHNMSRQITIQGTLKVLEGLTVQNPASASAITHNLPIQQIYNL